MSDGGGPHPELAFGLLKCTAKDSVGEAQFNVRFEGSNGSASFLLSPEDAAYFRVGEQYLFRASKP